MAIYYSAYETMKYILILLIALAISACAIFGDPTELDETRGWSAERIYSEAQAKMRDRDYEKAINYFKKLELRYPYGVYATQAQLEIAYAYFKKQEPVSCVVAADRFIQLHPNNAYLDYVYYLKAIALFDDRTFVEKLTHQDIGKRDPRNLIESFNTLKTLIKRFPNSRYSPDSALRMRHLANKLAEYEIHVARYYLRRRGYLAAVNRAKYVLENYPDSTSIEPALVILVQSYDLLELPDLKSDALRVLKLNYPNSRLLEQSNPNEERVWWKFWDSF